MKRRSQLLDQHARSAIQAANKEVATRRYLPELAASLARGRFRGLDLDNTVKTIDRAPLTRTALRRRSVAQSPSPSSSRSSRSLRHGSSPPPIPTKTDSYFTRAWNFIRRKGGTKRKTRRVKK